MLGRAQDLVKIRVSGLVFKSGKTPATLSLLRVRFSIHRLT